MWCWNSFRPLVTYINIVAFTGNWFMIMIHLLSEIPEADMGIVTEGLISGGVSLSLFFFLYLHLIKGEGREVVLFKIMIHASLPCVITLLWIYLKELTRGTLFQMPRLNDNNTWNTKGHDQTVSSHLLTHPIMSCVEMGFFSNLIWLQ